MLDISKIITGVIGQLFTTKLLALFLFLLLFVVLVELLRKDIQKIKSWFLFATNPTIPDVIDNMSGNEFELWVQGLFQKISVSATKVGGVGDHGIDLIVKYNNKKIAVQCKKYYASYHRGKFNRGYVGEPVVRNLYGSQHGGKFDQSLLITTGSFTYAAKKWAKDKPDLKLIDKQDLGYILRDPETLKKYL